MKLTPTPSNTPFSQQGVNAFISLLEYIQSFLLSRITKAWLNKSKKEAQIATLTDHIDNAKKSLINLLDVCYQAKLPELDTRDKIKDFQNVLWSFLNARIGAKLDDIPEVQNKRKQINMLLSVLRWPTLTNQGDSKRGAASIKAPESVSTFVLDKKPSQPYPQPVDHNPPREEIPKPPGQTISIHAAKTPELPDPGISIPDAYAELIDRTIDMCHTENRSTQLYTQLPAKIKRLTDSSTSAHHEKLAEFIVELNQQDQLALLIILLAQPDAQDLRRIVETQVPAGFWEQVLAGEHKGMGYPTGEYELSPTKTRGKLGYGLPGFLGPKKKQGIKLHPHRLSDSKNHLNNLPTRTPMEIIFGAYCSLQAKNYNMVIPKLEKLSKFLNEGPWGINDFNVLSEISAELTGIARIEYDDNLQLEHYALTKDYECYLRQDDPLKIMCAQETIMHSIEHLQETLKKTIEIFSKFYYKYLCLGIYWGDYQSAQKLYQSFQNHREKLPYHKLLNLQIAQLTLVGAPARDKHWLSGHFLYTEMIKDLVDILEKQNNSTQPNVQNKCVIYKLSLEALKNISIAEKLRNRCGNIIHNSYLGSCELILQLDSQKSLPQFL